MRLLLLAWLSASAMAGRRTSGDHVEEARPTPPHDPCPALAGFKPRHTATIERFRDLDSQAAHASGGLLFLGSSSIRLWEGLARAYADRRPIQRGIGGAEVAELALHTDALVTPHAPRGVVVFAGTNDVAAGVAPDTVVARFECLREGVRATLGPSVPVFFIGITPTPARWAQWAEADAVNEAIASLASTDPGLVYVDVPSVFLETGQPPSRDLFVADGLHLSTAGYALWNLPLRTAIDAVLPPEPAQGSSDAPLPAGTRLVLALIHDPTGPTPGQDGRRIHWNTWSSGPTRRAVLAGERLDGLRTDKGVPTGLSAVATGDFRSQGRVAGGVVLRGLDPEARYALRLSAGGDGGRATTWTVHGAGTHSATLPQGNRRNPSGRPSTEAPHIRFERLRPDPWGQIFIHTPAGTPADLDLAWLELIAE